MKNNIQFKIFILSILIIIPIGILYFNLGEDLFTDVKENLNNRIDGNYINICNPTRAQFYNSTPSPLEPIQDAKSLNTDISSCKYECDKNDCDLYLIKNNDCNIYNFKESGSEKIKVNCNYKPLPSEEYTYLGEGRVDKKFYNSNKDKFDHIDYLFDKALDENNGIIKDYMNINNELNKLKTGQESNRLPLYNMYDNVNLKLKKLADYLDLNRNSLYSNFVNNDYSMQETNKINLGNKELTYLEMLSEYQRLYDDSKDIEGRMDNDNLEYNRKYLVYTILTILMIITVIIFIVYKSLPDLFNDSFLIFYFIGVLLLVFFIHTYFKV